MTQHATIHVGCKKLGIEEDDRRDLYERITGKRSLTDMTPNDHHAVVSELRRMGFKPSSMGEKKVLEGKYASKLQALWIAAWNLGIIRNKHDKALLAFVKRQTGVDHTRFLKHAEDANKAIEAIKGILAKDGGVDWQVLQHDPDWMKQPGFKIAWAQAEKLADHDDKSPRQILEGACWTVGCPADLSSLTAGDWVGMMNELGHRVRRLG